jgi:hypothetical protein
VSQFCLLVYCRKTRALERTITVLTITQGRIQFLSWLMPNTSHLYGGPGVSSPGKFWNLGPRKCDILRSERTLLFQFIHQSHKITCCIFGKHVKNLYRKNNIISLYKKTIFTCTSVIAAVVYISLYSKIVSTVLLVALTFLLKNISAKNHEQRKYTHAWIKGAYIYSVIH